MSRLRLHKYIANCGYTSRRHAELLIRAGRVQVNGRTVTEAGTVVDPARDAVEINGDRVAPPPLLTIMLHKPPGFITSTHDTHERLTVMDLLPRRMREVGVKPVGRLDQDTSGLLVLTNDGDLNHRITHPRYEIEKEYAVEVEGRPLPEALRRIEEGLVIEGQRTSPARVSRLEPRGRTTRLNLVISEGRKRQIKKMFEAVGHPVEALRRVRVGNLQLGELPEGEWRELASGEIRSLVSGDRNSDRKGDRMAESGARALRPLLPPTGSPRAPPARPGAQREAAQREAQPRPPLRPLLPPEPPPPADQP